MYVTRGRRVDALFDVVVIGIRSRGMVVQVVSGSPKL